MPFDWPGAGVKSAPGATEGEAVSLKPYKVTVNGHPTTLLLSDEDAKRQGLLKPVEEKKAAAAPANKARGAKNKRT